MNVPVGPTTGPVLRVPFGEHAVPLGGGLRECKGVPDRLVPGMEFGVLDPELPHDTTRPLIAVRIHDEIEVCPNDVPLFVNRRRIGKRSALGEGLGLAEDPRVTNRPAGDRHAVDAGPLDHREAVGRGEQVAAAEDHPLADVKLTAHEYRVLSYLMHHQGRVVPRTELVEHIYDQDFDRDSNTIEVFIGRLRRKIGQDRIQTERGLGYRLVVPENEARVAG